MNKDGPKMYGKLQIVLQNEMIKNKTLSKIRELNTSLRVISIRMELFSIC